jgi:uncharacterized protein YkwD
MSRRRGLIRTAMLAAGLVLVEVALAPQQAQATSWYSAARTQCAGSARAMLCYHNHTRQIAGLRSLGSGWRLHNSARLKRRRIIRCGRITHQPCGDSWLRPFYQAHYLPTPCRWLVGENLAWNWATPWAAFSALMQSPTHRANILNPGFHTMGVSHSASRWGELWVIHYGRRC